MEGIIRPVPLSLHFPFWNNLLLEYLLLEYLLLEYLHLEYPHLEYPPSGVSHSGISACLFFLRIWEGKAMMYSISYDHSQLRKGTANCFELCIRLPMPLDYISSNVMRFRLVTYRQICMFSVNACQPANCTGNYKICLS